MSAVPAPDSGGDDDPAQRAWSLITQLFAERKSHFPEIAARFGLNPGAMHALLSIDPDAPQSMSALAGAWRCDASNVTWLVDRLEERGLAERRPHPSDRRVRTVALTRKGHRLRVELEAEIFAMPNALRQLSRRDLETLCRILGKSAPGPS